METTQHPSALEDRAEIANLKARYVDAADGGWTGESAHQGEVIASLFVADAAADIAVRMRAARRRAVENEAASREAYANMVIPRFCFHDKTRPRILLRLPGFLECLGLYFGSPH